MLQEQEYPPQPGDHVRGPRPQDVISSRFGKYPNHPQNVFCRQLIAEVAPSVTLNTNDGSSRKAAEHILDVIMNDKGGVFCREVSKNVWVVMDRKEALIKVQVNIRDKIYETTRKHKEQGKQQHNKQRSKSPQGPPKTFSVYDAQAGTETSIHPYALKLISAVCNVPNPRQALHVLDTPLSQCFSRGEPPKERKMRLQLRHRYAGALAMKITPVSFSKDLLALWGGSLVKKEIPSGLQAEQAPALEGDEQEQSVDSVMATSENDIDDEISGTEALEMSLSGKESTTDEGTAGDDSE